MCYSVMPMHFCWFIHSPLPNQCVNISPIFQVNRIAMNAATDEFGSTVGIRAWRSLLRRLQEMEALFGTFSIQMGRAPRVRVLYFLLIFFE